MLNVRHYCMYLYGWLKNTHTHTHLQTSSLSLSLTNTHAHTQAHHPHVILSKALAASPGCVCFFFCTQKLYVIIHKCWIKYLAPETDSRRPQASLRDTLWVDRLWIWLSLPFETQSWAAKLTSYAVVSISLGLTKEIVCLDLKSYSWWIPEFPRHDLASAAFLTH